MKKNFITSVTLAHGNADKTYEVDGGDSDLAMKEIVYILPVETFGSNKYFNEGMCQHHSPLLKLNYILLTSYFALGQTQGGAICTIILNSQCIHLFIVKIFLMTSVKREWMWRARKG